MKYLYIAWGTDLNKAEFKTLREALGFSIQDVANLVQVNHRSVRRWEDAEYTQYRPPENVYDQFKKLDADFDNAAFEALTEAKLKEQALGEKPKVKLMRFLSNASLWESHPNFSGMTTTVHAAMLFRAKKLLEQHNFNVEIIYE